MAKEGDVSGKSIHIAKKHWSIAMCINHWAMAVAIVVLILTGFYIAEPFTAATGETWHKYLMANMRFVHLVFGFILTSLFVWRIYLAFFSCFHADWKDFFAWLNFKNTFHAIKFYTLITTDPPEHTGLYGSLQSAAYLFLLSMVCIIVTTGLILYSALYKAGLAKFLYTILSSIEGLIGGLAGTRFIHHALTWIFIFFIIVHTYLAFWYDAVFKQGTISSIINGRIFEETKDHEI
jgi:Ni/Fe-hydrogenase 1 B-type cytochrome subunit